MDNTIIALEIGSSKIKGATATIAPDGSIRVMAVEEEPILDTVRYGCIRNIVETAHTAANVISRLEDREAPGKITSLYLGVGGRSMQSQLVEIDRPLPGETIITRDIIQSVTEEALSTPLHERTIVDVTPSELLIDSKETAKPIGTMGSHILARLNIISCNSQTIRNLTVAIEERVGLKIAGIYASPLALADLVLEPDEKRLGCMLVDCGAETTTVAIYRRGILVRLAVLPMGSRNITRDLTDLNYLEEQAEQLKKNGGSAFPTHDAAFSPSQPDFVAINNYISARAGEIILNILEQIKYAALSPDKLPQGIILTGGGAKLNGFIQRLQQISGMNVRTGMPARHIRILDTRINPADTVDVTALINQAARHKPQDCITRTRPVQPVQPQPIQPNAATPPSPNQPQPGQPYTPGYNTGRTQAQGTGTTTANYPGTTTPGTPPRPVAPTDPKPIPAPPAPKPVPTPAPPSAAPSPAIKKTGLFGRFIGQLKDNVANLISDNFQEEED